MPAAAQIAGVSESTLWRWLRDEAFHRAYMEARRKVVTQALSQLQAARGEAVDRLRAVMGDGDAAPSARVTAARTVMNLALTKATLVYILGTYNIYSVFTAH